MNKATTFIKKEDVTRSWVVIDAAGVSVGRIATLAAHRLTGKYQPAFTPHVDSGDHVVIINAESAQLTGKKTDQKQYHRHTGFPGGIKTRSVSDVESTNNTDTVISKAVQGMIPANKLKKGRMARLHVYSGAEHTHAGQNPTKIEVQ